MNEELKNFQIPQNTGVQERDPEPGDYMSEGDTGIEYMVNEESGNWDQHLVDCDVPPGDYQWGVYGDGSTCTNYACKHSIHTQINRLLSLGKIPAQDIEKLTKAGFIVNGKFVELSARFNAIKSGTIRNWGNYLYRPWDSARHDGMVPEALCPFPRLQVNPVFDMDRDYFNRSIITPQVEAVGKIFNEVFEIRYEIVPVSDEMILKHLKQAPLAIISGVCYPWSDVIIPACSLTSGHATTLYGYEEGKYKKDLDSYHPTRKKLAWDYKISYIIKGVVLVRTQQPKPEIPKPVHYVFQKDLSLGSRGKEVTLLQNALKTLGYFPTNVKSTEYFGNVTQGAVIKFQKAYKISPSVGYFGPLTRSKINSLNF